MAKKILKDIKDIKFITIGEVLLRLSPPNFEKIREIKKISFNNKIIYEPEFGLCGLSEDETAIATLMCKTAEYSRGQALPPYSLENALADAYAAILLDEAVRTSNKVSSCIEKICIAKNK